MASSKYLQVFSCKQVALRNNKISEIMLNNYIMLD